MDTPNPSPNGQDGAPHAATSAPSPAAGAPVASPKPAPPPVAEATASASATPASSSTWTPWTDSACQPTDYRRFMEGEVSPFKTKIVRIFGRGRDFLIYANDSGRLAIHFNDPLPTRMRPAIQEYRRLTTIATIALDRGQQEKAQGLIATGLIHAFTSADDTDVLAGMAPAKAFIESRAVAQARSNLMLVVAATAIAVFAALWILKYDVFEGDPRAYLPGILLGGMAGIAGSAISWIQRSADVEIDMYAPTLHRCFQGAMRVLLGMVFGVIVVVAAHSKFAFTIAATEPYALCMVALAGGFSERLVPDVISRVGQEQASETSPRSS